jgi:DNA-binding CsgD family transcriptional regulator
MLQRQQEALSRLSQAVHLAAPAGYIRSFVDEGTSMAALLSRLRAQERQAEDLPYLETLLRAFHQKPGAQPTGLESEPSPSPPRPLMDPLSAREQEVLHLLARGDSNQDIAEALAVATTTIKNHVSNILSKLGVTNRTQAVARARALGLRHAPGFVSASLHRSTDGTKVTMYAQWRSVEDYQAMRQDPTPLPFLQEALAIARFDPGMYEVVQTFAPFGG